MTHYASPLALNMPIFNVGDFTLVSATYPQWPNYPLPAFMSGNLTNLTQSAATTIKSATALQALDVGTYIFCISADVGLASFVQGVCMFTVYLGAAGAKTVEISQTYYTGNVVTNTTPTSNSVCIYNISQSPSALQVYNSFTTAQSNVYWVILRF
jgi:hypothetical protein